MITINTQVEVKIPWQHFMEDAKTAHVMGSKVELDNGCILTWDDIRVRVKKLTPDLPENFGVSAGRHTCTVYHNKTEEQKQKLVVVTQDLFPGFVVELRSDAILYCRNWEREGIVSRTVDNAKFTRSMFLSLARAFYKEEIPNDAEFSKERDNIVLEW